MTYAKSSIHLSMRKSLLAALFILPCVSSCALVAGAAAGTVIYSETTDSNVYVGQLNSSGQKTWAQTKVTLSNLSLKPIDVDDAAMRATADIDGATVTVNVSTYDYQKSEIKVAAKKYMVNDGATAKMVFDKVVADLNDQR